MKRVFGIFVIVLILLSIMAPFTAYAAEGADQSASKIAYDGSRYLVVYEYYTYSSETNYIYGVFLDKDSTPMAEPFKISEADGYQRHVDVCSGSNGDFMVIWSDESNENSKSIYGRLVNGQNSFSSENDILISEGTFPSIAYDSTNDRYLAVWQDINDSKIHARFLDSDGTFSGDSFQLSDNTGSQEMPDVAYNEDTKSFIAVWMDNSFSVNSFYITKAVIDAVSGSVTPDEEPINMVELPDLYYQSYPSIVSSNGNSTVVWAEDGDYNGYRISYIKAAMIDNTGNTDVKIVSQEHTSDTSPVISYSPSFGRYLIAWHEAGDIPSLECRYMDVNGTFTGNEFTAGEGANPSISADNPGGNFLAGFDAEDTQNGTYDLEYRMFDLMPEPELYPEGWYEGIIYDLSSLEPLTVNIYNNYSKVSDIELYSEGEVLGTIDNYTVSDIVTTENVNGTDVRKHYANSKIEFEAGYLEGAEPQPGSLYELVFSFADGLKKSINVIVIDSSNPVP